MEVILRETIAKVGRAGQVVQVKDGYARNYLLPRGLAYPATPGNKRRVEAESRHTAALQAAGKSDAEAVAARLAELELHFTAKAGDGDKLFGSVTSGDIAEQLTTKGVPVDKRAVQLEEPIRMIGAHTVAVRLHPEVQGHVRVWVVKDT